MERKSALPKTSLTIRPPDPPAMRASRQSDCATASAEIGRGLHMLLESNGDIREIVSAIHEALSKEPPPSKIPEALADLGARIDGLAAGFQSEVQSLRNSIEAFRREIESNDWR
jgi:hypothetical protein